jgi:hypothetical protein
MTALRVLGELVACFFAFIVAPGLVAFYAVAFGVGQ